MAAGLVHDRITINTAGIWFLVGLGVTADFGLAAASAIGCVVGGYWLSPDLDIRSHPFQRWGPLRIIWIPYQKLIRHRSTWSHGPLIGTTLRVLYLAIALGLGWLLLLGLAAIGFSLLGGADRYASFEAATLAQTRAIGQWLWVDQFPFLVAGFVGLEVGALSHIATDHLSSWQKRRARRAKRSTSQARGRSPGARTSSRKPARNHRSRSGPTRNSQPKRTKRTTNRPIS